MKNKSKIAVSRTHESFRPQQGFMHPCFGSTAGIGTGKHQKAPSMMTTRAQKMHPESSQEEAACISMTDESGDVNGAIFIGEEYPYLPSLQTLAEELNMTVTGMYQRLHQEGILYRRHYSLIADDGHEDFVFFVYSDYRNGLFECDNYMYEGPHGYGATASCLKVTAAGWKFIKALMRRHSAMEVYRRLFPRRRRIGNLSTSRQSRGMANWS